MSTIQPPLLLLEGMSQSTNHLYCPFPEYNAIPHWKGAAKSDPTKTDFWAVSPIRVNCSDGGKQMGDDIFIVKNTQCIIHGSNWLVWLIGGLLLLSCSGSRDAGGEFGPWARNTCEYHVRAWMPSEGPTWCTSTELAIQLYADRHEVKKNVYLTLNQPSEFFKTYWLNNRHAQSNVHIASPQKFRPTSKFLS